MKDTLASYDEMPYESHAFARSSPERLATLGRLFGMKTPDLATAKVLELGCASGGNLLPHAIAYPNAQFVGIDLSQVQIEDGLKHVQALGLKNIKLIHGSITDIDTSFGVFDYIICHGVFSWVPDTVRDKILEVAHKNLTPTGIAYVSYNTLPGWNMMKTIRDMMLYHVDSKGAEKDKVTQARAMLGFISEAAKTFSSPYSTMLDIEQKALSRHGDHYVNHEYLETQNRPYYLTDFVELAKTHGLRYLADAEITSLYLGNLQPVVADKLRGLNDLVKMEQYLDFIKNRRFRASLLCHQSIQLNRAINNNIVREFALSASLRPEKPLNQQELESTQEIKFYIRGSDTDNLATFSPRMKAILYVLAENSCYPLTVQTIVNKASALFSGDCEQEIEAELIDNAMSLVLMGHIELSLLEKDKSTIRLDRPQLSELALYQLNALNSTWITNSDLKTIDLKPMYRVAAKLMDGTRTTLDIVAQLEAAIARGELDLGKDQVQFHDKALLHKELTQFTEKLITKLFLLACLK